MSVAFRLAAIRERIERAYERRGKGPPPRLVGVSKKQTVAAIREAYAAGLRDFGENYAQELRDKREALADLDLRWHFIGPLQSNKTKYMTGVSLLHTVDRPEIVDALHQRLHREGQVLEVLVQVNVGEEPQKSGCSVSDLPRLLDSFARAPRVRCRGLMTIPPIGALPATRDHFRALAELHQRYAQQPREGVELRELSMGMSDDFEIAIEEGATLVRVGSAIFGARVNEPNA